eukprot:evm.model.scf_2245.3 EVM.evm.TU.scf_2245.3   scf_2245:14533-15775(+)
MTGAVTQPGARGSEESEPAPAPGALSEQPDDACLPRPPSLRPCQHQVAGHLFENGKAGSLVDDFGRFYKPLQAGGRGKRELEFYARSFGRSLRKRNSREEEDREGARKRGLASGRGAAWKTLFRFVPRYIGTADIGGSRFLVLEDVGVTYRKPCVIDIKIGFQTWYPNGDEHYVRRAHAKDAATTQSTIGFKICGWRVYKHGDAQFYRASKTWCKTMPLSQVSDALLCFADNEAGLDASNVFGGPFGAIAQLRELEAWFVHQREFLFYSSSVLIVYEGDAACVEDSDVRVRLVDFAHTFKSDGQRDKNFAEGLSSLMDWLEDAVRFSPGAGGGRMGATRDAHGVAGGPD